MQIPNLRLTLGGEVVDIDRYFSMLIKPLFLIFIYFAIFGRNVIIFGVGGGLASVLTSFLLAVLTAIHFLFLRREKTISQLSFLITVFFILISVKPFISFFIYDEKANQILRYSLELGINFAMLFSTYYFIKQKVISPRFFLYAFGFMGAIVSVQLLINLIGMTVVRRVAGLRGAINYTASSLAMCAVVWVMIINSTYVKGGSKRLVRLLFTFCLILVVFGLIITGSRAALLSLVIGLFLLQVFGMKSPKFKRYVIVFSFIVVALIGYLATKFDLTLLLERFTYDEIKRMALIRFDLYARSVVDLSAVEFIFGRPDFYTFDDDVSGARIVNTHNIFLSLIRFNGFPAFLIFVLILWVIFKNYFALYQANKSNHRVRLTESSIMILLVMALIYSMFSGGRTTRIFVVFVQVGFAVGYLDLIRSVKSSEEYKKFIL